MATILESQGWSLYPGLTVYQKMPLEFQLHFYQFGNPANFGVPSLSVDYFLGRANDNSFGTSLDLGYLRSNFSAK